MIPKISLAIFAEDEAKERHVMKMQDWVDATDDLLKFRRKVILKHSGNVSHKQAMEKAESDYEKYRVIQDQKYISTMDEFYNKYLNENRKVGGSNEWETKYQLVDTDLVNPFRKSYKYRDCEILDLAHFLK